MVSRGDIVAKRVVKINKQSGTAEINYSPVTRKPKPGSQFSVIDIGRDSENFDIDPNTLMEYKVRIPLIHGLSTDTSAVPDSQLPWAVYYPLPGSQATELSIGDQVLVTIVDFKFDDIAIIGIVTQKENLGVALQKVQFAEMDKDAPLIVSKIQIGTGQNSITNSDLEWLKKKDSVIWGIEQGGLGVNLKENSNEAKAKKKTVLENLGIFNVELISQSKFDDLNGQLEKNTIYYIWDDQES